MREVAQRCPSCGSRTFRPVDLWSGTPDAELGDRLCSSCARRGPGGRTTAASVSIDTSGDRQAIVFWAVVLVALVAGLVEAIRF